MEEFIINIIFSKVMYVNNNNHNGTFVPVKRQSTVSGLFLLADVVEKCKVDTDNILSHFFVIKISGGMYSRIFTQSGSFLSFFNQLKIFMDNTCRKPIFLFTVDNNNIMYILNMSMNDVLIKKIVHSKTLMKDVILSNDIKKFVINSNDNKQRNLEVTKNLFEVMINE